MRNRITAEVQKPIYDINDNFLNIISPSGFNYSDITTSLGENIGKVYAIVRYPFTADYGWLAHLCNLEGTSTAIEYIHTDPSRLVAVFNKRISELRGKQETLKKESEKQANEKNIKDIKKMIERITINNEPVGYVSITLHIQAENMDKLTERVKKISSICAVQGCNLKLMKYRQEQGIKVMAPYGIPDERVSNMGARNMPISTFFGGFPMANPGLNDEDGYYIGKTTNDRLVILNMWLRNKDRTNSNWSIFGVPGVGKSTILKSLFTKEFAYGTRIIMFDPEVEYKDLALHRDIQGQVINCSGGSSGRINPLQVRAHAKVTQEDLNEDESLEDYFSYDDAENESDLALFIQQLKAFFKLYFGKENWTAGISATLERCLLELYEDFNITWDTDISQLRNEDFPIMSDLYQKVVKKGKEADLSNYRKENYEKLEDLLFSAGEGADRLWNGHTTLEANADFVDLLINDLLDAEDNVKRAQFFNIIQWGWNEVASNRLQRILFGVEEGYLTVDEEYPDVMKFLRNFSKRSRKYEGGLLFITHSVVDILDPAVKRYGQAIIDNSCYKFIMGCDGKNLEETRKLFNLSEREVGILSQKNRGQGILFAGNTRLDLKVDVSDNLLAMFGSAGGR